MNFTAEPVSKLYQQTFYCGVSQLYDGFSGYCNRYTTGFDDVTLKFATTGSSRAYLIKDRTVHTVAENGYATAFLNLSSWIGGLPATGSFSIQYKLKTELSTSRIKSYTAQLLHRYEQRREVRRRIYIYYISAASGTIPPCLSSAFYGYSISCTSVLYSSQSPPTDRWLTWTIPKIYDYGVVAGVAFGAYH